ncbi:MAG: DUF899 family protein [Candidatus Marinimicrobia bacterium]|nr:DUF899 family protein [Candidatus Neomarinimicrobiota bacterium]
MNNTLKIEKLEKEISKIKKEIVNLRLEDSNHLIRDFKVQLHSKKIVKLSTLFDEKKELLISFNMGKKCKYCTLWADEYNGIIQHLENRSPFFVVSPDSIETQKEFSKSRNWKFKMLSCQNMEFYKELGFYDGIDGTWPGVACLIKDDDENIYLYSKSYYGPGDNFCSMWDFNDLLPPQKTPWSPKYNY